MGSATGKYKEVTPTWTLPEEAKTLYSKLMTTELPSLSEYLSGMGEIAFEEVMPSFIRYGMGTSPELISRELGRTLAPRMMERGLEYETARLKPYELASQALSLGQYVSPTYSYTPGWLDYAIPGLTGAGSLLTGIGSL